MINKDKTLTVGDLLKMLADGRVTVDMPVAVLCGNSVTGIVAAEIVTFQDESKGFLVYTGQPCESVINIASSAEIFI